MEQSVLTCTYAKKHKQINVHSLLYIGRMYKDRVNTAGSSTTHMTARILVSVQFDYGVCIETAFLWHASLQSYEMFVQSVRIYQITDHGINGHCKLWLYHVIFNLIWVKIRISDYCTALFIGINNWHLVHNGLQDLTFWLVIQ